MNIKFKQLESLRVNPKSINSKLVFGRARSRFTRWQDCIAQYHRTNEDVQEAEKYLDSSFGKMSKPNSAASKTELQKYLQAIYDYDVDYKKLSSVIFTFRKNMSFEVNLSNTFSGQIPRIDINTTDEGYSFYFFEKVLHEWENELRFPLLQSYLSSYFGCDDQEMKVGVYAMQEGKHFSKTFSKQEITDAKAELSNVVKEVERVIKK